MTSTNIDFNVGDQVIHADNEQVNYFGAYGRVTKVSKKNLTILVAEGTDYEEEVVEPKGNFVQYTHEFRSFVAQKEDCPDYLRNIIQEFEECINQLVAQNTGFLENAFKYENRNEKIQAVTRELMMNNHSSFIQAIQRFEARIDAAECIYYDQKFGYLKGRDRKRGYLLT